MNALKAHLAADPKKTLILGALVLVLGGVWGRLFLRHAGAAEIAPPRVVTELLTEGERSGENAPPMTRKTKSPAALYGVEPVAVDKAPRELARELWAADWTRFAACTTPRAGEKAENQGIFAELRKLARDSIARQHKLQDRLRNESRNLTVSSTILGQSPVAVINGHIVHPGDHVDGFEVVQIGSRSVTVRKLGVTFDIVMRP